MLDLARAGALDGKPALDGLGPVAPATRFLLRGRDAAIVAAGTAFGVTLPLQACRSAEAGERAALWLGPDEYLLLAEDGMDGAALAAALDGMPHSLVEVSHRWVGLSLNGPHSATALNAGCPLDLDISAFPVGMCTRTLLAKTEIVLWRRADAGFRLEVARSFASYAWDFLVEARRDLVA